MAGIITSNQAMIIMQSHISDFVEISVNFLLSCRYFREIHLVIFVQFVQKHVKPQEGYS